MRRYDFTQMEALVAVATAGGYAAAGRRSNSSASSFSQKVSALEAQIGVRLLVRSGRYVKLTPEGERLVAALRPALIQCTGAVREIREASRRLEATVRLCIDPLASEYVRPRVTEFLNRYPGVKIDISISDLPLDIVEKRFDLGVRTWQEIPRGMRAKQLSSVEMVVAASPAFLASRDFPRTPTDLEPHLCLPVIHGETIQNWHFKKGTAELVVHPTGRFVSNNRLMLVDAALMGLGFICVENVHVERLRRSGKLVSVLTEWMPPGTALFGFSAKASHLLVRLLLKHLIEVECPHDTEQ